MSSNMVEYVAENKYRVHLPDGSVYFADLTAISPQQSLAERVVVALLSGAVRHTCHHCAMRRMKKPAVTQEQRQLAAEAGISDMLLDRDREFSMADEGCPNFFEEDCA